MHAMESDKSKKVKVNDLPLYPCCSKKIELEKNESANIIEPYVSETRKEICSFLSPYLGDSFERFNQIIETSKAHTSDIIDIVRNDQNQAARATFITSAAFFGYLIGRKGFFRRTLFAAVAAGSAAAICEPKMAKDYAEVTLDLAKQKFTECYKEYGAEYFENFSWDNWFKSKSSDKNE